ncbi:MAG: GntR family transcriptional regulator [Phycisphaerae bacterium]|nr:GntR family transcriptional regulator [Phycisphaerae bacterium]
MAKPVATTVDRVHERIRQKLLRGELARGQRVSQRKLAREFGCSPVPVAEAMRRLESEGLLVKEPLKIARVRTLSLRDLEGLYLIREGLESVAARLCAQRITDDQIAELKGMGHDLEEAVLGGDTMEQTRLDVAIHRFIYRCAECPLLESELDRLLILEKTAGRNDPIDRREYLHRHKALIQAIADRDGDSAEYLAKRHVRSGYEYLASHGLTD